MLEGRGPTRFALLCLFLASILAAASLLLASTTPQPSSAPPIRLGLRDRDHESGPSLAVTPAAARFPRRLLISRARVDAAVIALGVDSAGNMSAPATGREVGWYEGGPAPGESGDAVLDGHLNWIDGPAVFQNLAALQAGDDITVLRGDGARLRFRVESAGIHPYTSHPAGLFAPDGPPRLSLITCSGAWDRSLSVYRDRLVIDAQLVAVETT